MTRDPAVKSRALSGLNATTYMQSEAGLFRTHFYDTVAGKEKDPAKVNNWYSQHLYTICHIIECMPVFPELAPDGQDHILESSVGVHDVAYPKGAVRYATRYPADVTMKLGFAPKTVTAGGRPLGKLSGDQGAGWSFDAASHVLTIRQGEGSVVVSQ